MGRPGVVDYTMLCVLAAIWGGSFMLLRIAVVEVPPVMTTALRQGVAAVVFVAIAVSAGERLRASRSDHLVIILPAFFGMALPFSLINWGLQELTAGFAAILIGLMPLMTIVLAHFTTHDEKMNLQKVVGVVFGILGLVVLFWPDLVGGSDSQFWRQMAVMAVTVSIRQCFNTAAWCPSDGHRFADHVPHHRPPGCVLFRTDQSSRPHGRCAMGRHHSR